MGYQYEEIAELAANNTLVIADCMHRDRFSKLRNHATVVDNNAFTDEQKAADQCVHLLSNAA